MEIRFLDEDDRTQVHETFRAAFADYAVPADFDRDTLDRLMARRGADLSASVGCFDGSEMAAVMAVAVREYEGLHSAYDVFTGVRPKWRGRKLAGLMFDHARRELANRDVVRFVLEVIESNGPAVHAYTRTGFITRRRLDCYEVDAPPRESGPEPAVDSVREPDWGLWHEWEDWSASWQNSPASLAASPDEVSWLVARVDGETAGYAAVVPGSRDLPRLAVAQPMRRRGVGTALLRAACRLCAAGPALRVINVDANADADRSFYRRFVSQDLPAQLEMVLDLG